MLKQHFFWLAIGYLMGVGVLILGVIPPLVSSAEINHFDKIMHLLGYAILAGWFGNIYRTQSSRWRASVALFLLGILIEIIQYYLPYRTFDFYDMLANGVGVLMGIVFTKTQLGEILTKIEKLLKMV